MLVLLGLVTIIVLLAGIMFNKMSPLLALIAVPIIVVLIGDFGLETRKFIVDGIQSIAPVAAMFVFVILFFGTRRSPYEHAENRIRGRLFRRPHRTGYRACGKRGRPVPGF
jgi:CitMHS family citrate-Mg2+:H+ or citrate-Ca2+:H+ symporter